MVHARRVAGLVGLLAILAVVGVRGQVPGWDPRWPSVDTMLQGHDAAKAREFRQRSAEIARNGKDIVALNARASLAMGFASGRQLYGSYWRWLAAKDLEQVVTLDPKNFVGWHNYGDLNYRSGDFWMTNDHGNAERAVTAFSKAIALNPQSARSYMGRGWAYLTMDDPRANADFDTALKLDPSLRSVLQSEIQDIQERKRQVAAARGTLDQMGRYYVERSARTQQDCDRYRGLWTQNECRISMALYPGPRQPGEALR